MSKNPLFVIPAKAGIQNNKNWTPAFAGVTFTGERNDTEGFQQK